MVVFYSDNPALIVDNEKIAALPVIDINSVFRSTLQTFVNYFKIINDRYSVKMKEDIRKIEMKKKYLNFKFLEKKVIHKSESPSVKVCSPNSSTRHEQCFATMAFAEIESKRSMSPPVRNRMCMTLYNKEMNSPTTFTNIKLMSMEEKEENKQKIDKLRKQNALLLRMEQDTKLPLFYTKKFNSMKRNAYSALKIRKPYD
jgi:hypothetical protein